MASLLLTGARPDTPDKRKKIPKVAVYVAGAAFAITTGLTLLILPYVRQAARMSTPPVQFLSNRHLLKSASLISPAKHSSGSTAGPTSFELETRPSAGIELDPQLRSSRGFNAREERELFGPEPIEGESAPVGGLMGLQALAIATGLVFGSAGLGMWGVARLLGVRDMAEFSTKMREELQIRMPVLFDRVNPSDDAQSAALDKWLRQVDEDDAKREAEAQAKLA